MPKSPTPPADSVVEPLEYAEEGEYGPMMLELRRRAEVQLRKQGKNKKATAFKPQSEVEVKRMLQELQVHQIELEMQNTELQEARGRMESLLEKYTDLYDFSPVGYFTLNTQGKIQLVNLTGALLFGVARSRLLGQSFGLLLSAPHRPVFTAFLKKVFTERNKEKGDFHLLNEGQPLKILKIRAQCSPDGEDCRVVVVDITEQKRAEDHMRVSEIRYRRLFEAAQDGVLLLDPTTRKITEANPFMTRLLGYSHDQLIGKELFEIGLIKDEGQSRAMFQKLKQTHQVRYENLPLESQQGEHQEVEVVANLYEENGRPVIQCNIRDIRVRKAAEEILLRSETLFSSLIDQAPFGIYVVNARFQLQQGNTQALSLFRKINPLLGRDFSEIVHILWPKRVADQVVERFRQTLKTGEPYQSPEFTERRRDRGAQETYEWQIQRVTLPVGELGVVCFFNNITERKHAEEIRRRVAVLDASNQKLKQEILQRLEVEKSLKKSKEHQTKMLQQSRHQQEQLRQLSREVLRAQEEERKRISRELHDVIAQTLSSINLRLAGLKKEAGRNTASFDRDIAQTQLLVGKSVDIVHQFARELRPAVLDDLGLIPALHAFLKDFTTRTGVRAHLTAFAGVEQLENARRTVFFRVAQEALTNVARHAKASEVAVTIKKWTNGVEMKIKDNGKSFEVQRVLLARGSKRLGLLGMRERVEMVGGTFGVESVLGQGTTITVQIAQGKTDSIPARSVRLPNPRRGR